MTSTLWPPGSWEVLLLFLIPVGGGIPAGVLLARARGIGWPLMEMLYLISDVILACAFEPLMRGAISAGRGVAFLERVGAAMRRSLERTASLYGGTGGPLTLILIAFGVDPMTGRAAAAAAGHGFLSGWTLSISGDMLFFTLIMASTLWLNSLLGDGRWTTAIILVLMIGVPLLIRRRRERLGSTRPSSDAPAPGPKGPGRA
jgi:hypothetical protein